MFRIFLALFLIVSAIPRAAFAAIPTEVAASFLIPADISSWFNDGAGMATDGIVFDNREAQSFTASATGELDRVQFSAFRTANTTAALRINLARSTNGKPGEVLGTATVDPASVPTDRTGTPTMNLTALFTSSRVILRSGETYFLVFLSDTTEANYRLYGNDAGHGRFESQNGRPYEASGGALFHKVIVFSDRAPVAIDDFVTTRGGAVTLDPLANDRDPEGDPLTITNLTRPAHGRVEVIDNKFRYIPHTSVTEADSFSYTVSDSNGKQDSATVKVTNPFYVLSGRWEATLQIGESPAGKLALKITKTGQITGTLTIEGKKYAFNRTLDFDGSLTTTLTARGQEPVTLNLSLASAPGLWLTGTVDAGSETYQIAHGGMLASNLGQPFQGKYTFRFPGNSEGANPRGTGYATSVLTRHGMLKLRGRLPDLTPFTAAIPLQYYGVFVVNQPLYRGGGYLRGLLLMHQSGPDNSATITGDLILHRPAQPDSLLFPEGFEITVPTQGDRYFPPQRDESAIQSSEATVVVLSGQVEIDVRVSARDVVRAADPATSRELKLHFNRATGKFSGSVLLPPDDRLTRFDGVWKWRSGFGEGLFFSENQSAPLLFQTPAAPLPLNP